MIAIVYWLHLIAIVFWVGGILVNILVLMPSMQAISPPERGKMMGAFAKRFGPLAWSAVGLIFITGIILTNQVIDFALLFSFTTSYGNLLLTKIALVVVMVLNGVYISFVLGPKMEAPASPPDASPAAGPPPALLKAQKQMAALSKVQIALALAVLLMMGLL